MGIPKEHQTKITEELEKRIRSKDRILKCPICGNEDFIISDGYTRRMLNDDIGNVKFSGLNIPSITTVCTNCGYILDFSLGLLGFLSKKEEGKKDGQEKK